MPHPHQPCGLGQEDLGEWAVLPFARLPWAFPEGLWRLDLCHSGFSAFSLISLSSLFSPRPILACFKAVSRLPQRMSFSSLKKTVYGKSSAAQALQCL